MVSESVVKEIWEKCRAFNIEYKAKFPKELAGFRWQCFAGAKYLMPEIIYEYTYWIDYLIKHGLPDFDPAVRHREAVENRMAAGWRKGKARDNLAKIDPYLIEFGMLPEWLREMCIGRDKIVLDILRSKT